MCVRRDSLNERKDITSCRKTNALYQGTALAGPYPVLLMRALAPEVLLSRPVQTFSAASIGAGYVAFGRLQPLPELGPCPYLAQAADQAATCRDEGSHKQDTLPLSI